MSVFPILRGRYSLSEADEVLSRIKINNKDNIIEWIPDSWKAAHIDVSVRSHKGFGAYLTNHTGIQELFKRIGD